MEKRVVRTFAPATVANVGSAFDVLGFAVDSPGDEVEVERNDEAGISIELIDGDGGKLPKDPSRNTASVGARHVLLRAGLPHLGLRIKVYKQMPLGSGLGSSAASAAAGCVATNILIGSPLSKTDLIQCAMEGERVACGSAHADNVAPAILGGFVLIRSYDPIDIVALPVPPSLLCVLVHPSIEVLTEDARKILRKNVPLSLAVRQFAQVGGLVAGICLSDPALIGRSVDDKIIEPERSSLIPGYYAVKKSAMDAGALGCGISGSGPSLFAFVTNEGVAARVGEAMQQSFLSHGIESRIFISPVNATGAREVSSE